MRLTIIIPQSLEESFRARAIRQHRDLRQQAEFLLWRAIELDLAGEELTLSTWLKQEEDPNGLTPVFSASRQPQPQEVVHATG